MNKKVTYALILIAISVIVLVLNRQPAEVDLIFFKIKGIAAFVYLAFVALGVVIGVLLK